MATLLSTQRIIDCLNTNYGIKVTKLTRLLLGADINASVYKAEAQNHSSYFVKLKRGHHADISTTIITLLRDAGIQQIISPLTNNRGQAIQSIDDFTLIVSPFIEGHDGFSRDLTNEQWIMLGKVMRQVHEVTVPSEIQKMIRRESYSSQWRERVRALYVHIEAQPSGDEIALKLIDSMKKHAKTIHHLIDRSEQLSQKIKIKSQSHEFVLCHSDIHGGNILIDSNNAFYVVDWDEPIMAPKERDLMFIGGGVANVWNKQHEEKLFYTGYGKTEINKILLAYYRYERIVEDIAVLGEQLLLTPAHNQNREELYNHFIAQFEPQGVVEIAFKTEC